MGIILKRHALLLYTIGFLAMGMIIKTFAYELFEAPGKSMEDTIFANDIVLVDKLTLKFRPVKLGDILVFRLAKGGFITKRCLGTPGRYIRTIEGEIYLDEHPVRGAQTVKMKYLIQLSGKRNFHRFTDSANIRNRVYTDSANCYTGNLSLREIQAINSYPYTKKVRKIANDSYPFVFNKLYPQWTLEDWGPLKVPGKGMVIVFNKNNYELYKQLLFDYESIKVQEVGGKYYVGDKEIKSYTIKNDYYFVMGDNRTTSVDSRYFGFVCGRFISGKIRAILFSRLDGEFRWDRFFKFTE